ncbi:MAG: tripartite tricarboxylate transporter TctB family protein [Anaerovoracaceae bacterium]
MAKWKRDVLYGIVILILAAAGAFEIRDMKIMGNPAWITRPDTYMWMWLGILAVFAILLITRALIKKDEEKQAPIWTKEGIFTIVMMFLYLVSMEILGFTLSTFLFEAILIFVYSYKMGKLNSKGKKLYLTIALYIAIALIATLVTQYLFTEALSVRLPKGKIF